MGGWQEAAPPLDLVSAGVIDVELDLGDIDWTGAITCNSNPVLLEIPA
jgi:hypothetical protein